MCPQKLSNTTGAASQDSDPEATMFFIQNSRTFTVALILRIHT